MTETSITDTLKTAFDELPTQLQIAARWVLDNPADVALLTLREQAKRAGVLPATLTRLAKRLGFDGYDEIRRHYADGVRQRPEGFRGRAEELIALRNSKGEVALVRETFSSLSKHLDALTTPIAISRFSAAADRVYKAKIVYCWGLRSSFPVAYLFHYIRSLFGGASVLADGPGSIGIDCLRRITKDDVLLVVTAYPYTVATIDAARYASENGASIVAITDSEHSPIAPFATELLIVGTETPAFLHTMTPAFAAVECLAALVATRRGGQALAELTDSDAHLANFGTYIKGSSTRTR